MRVIWTLFLVTFCIACQGRLLDSGSENNNSNSDENNSNNSGGNNSNNEAPPPGPIDEAREALHAQALALMSSATLRCAGCHDSERLDLKSGTIADFADRLVRRASEIDACNGEQIIDPVQPERSLLLKLIDGRRTESACIAQMPLGENGVAAEDYAVMADWVDALIDVYEQSGGLPPEPGPVPIRSDVAQPADAFHVLQKVKYLVVGSAVTEEELTSVRGPDGALRQDRFETIVKSWLQTSDFEAKRRNFFELVLQQNPADGNYTRQLRNTVGVVAAPFVRNIQESLIRTAERIYKDREDFRSIMWTTRHEVTTAVLIILKMADNPRVIGRTGSFDKGNAVNNLREVLSRNYDDRTDPLYQNDISDWRTVDLQYDQTSTQMRQTEGFEDGSNLASLRSIEDGGSIVLRTPRTLCSSPAFFQMWQTNRDNRFRAQINQCLIIALGSTFATADPTKPPLHPLPGLREREVPSGSECMGCHKNLDPMLGAFEAHFDYENQRYRPHSPAIVDFYIQEAARVLNYDPDAQGRGPRYIFESFPAPYFSYKGVNEPGTDLLSLVRSV
ncbi:MAG: hypothetical protein AAF449_20330, partial [Myxococcota bacterium]